MSRSLVILLILLGPTLFGTTPPKFIMGFYYTAVLDVTKNGTPYTYYVIEGPDVKVFKKSIAQFPIKKVSLGRYGTVWIYRRIEGWSVMKATGKHISRFIVVKNS